MEAFLPEAVKVEAFIYDETQSLQSSMGGIQPVGEKIMLFDAPAMQCTRDEETGLEKYLFRAGGEMEHIAPGDGICIYVDPTADPDYRITSITQEGHLVCRLEKI